MQITLVKIHVPYYDLLETRGKELKVRTLDDCTLAVYYEIPAKNESKIAAKMKELEELFEEQKELHYRGLSHA